MRSERRRCGTLTCRVPGRSPLKATPQLLGSSTRFVPAPAISSNRPPRLGPGQASRNSERVSLFHRGSLLPPTVAIDDRKHFVCALCRITTHIVIGDLHVDGSVPRHAA